MRNKAMRGIMMAMVAMSLFAGCGKEDASKSKEDTTKQVLVKEDAEDKQDTTKQEAKEKDKEKVQEHEEVKKQEQEEAKEQEEASAQDVTLDTWEKIENYKMGKIEQLRQLAENTGMVYDMAAGNIAIHGTDEEVLLEKEYETEFFAISFTNYLNRHVSTQVELLSEYHPDKRLSDEYIEFLYGLIQATDNQELKDMIGSVDELKEISKKKFYYSGGGCELVINDKYSFSGYVDFVYRETKEITVEEEEKRYTEFDSLQEYESFVDSVKERIYVDTHVDSKNNLAVGFSIDDYARGGYEKHTPEEVVAILDEYFHMTEVEKTRLVSELYFWTDIDSWNSQLLDERFYMGINYMQYPNEVMDHDPYFVFPIKVQGLKNR